MVRHQAGPQDQVVDGLAGLARADVAVDEYLIAIAGHLPDKEEAMALRSLELWARAMVESRKGPRPGTDDTKVAAGGHPAPKPTPR